MPIPINERARREGSRCRSSSPRKKVKPRVYDFRGAGCEACPHCGGCTASPPMDMVGFRGFAPSGSSRRSQSMDQFEISSSSTSGPTQCSINCLRRKVPSSAGRSRSPDSSNWVQLPTYDGSSPAGGRHWASTDVSNKVGRKEVRANDPPICPVAPKLTEPRSDIRAGQPNANRLPLAHKVNIPDEESRNITIRQIEKDRQDRTQPPPKITQKARYGEWPNYKMSQDRTYIRSPGPDEIHAGIGSKVTNSPPPYRTGT